MKNQYRMKMVKPDRKINPIIPDGQNLIHSLNFNGQMLQDLFVNYLLDIDNGFFLDIGAGVGGISDCPLEFLSNTCFFEKYRGWSGIGIDHDEFYINKAKDTRSCTLSCTDLLETNINALLKDLNCPEVVDYLSFDVDDATEKVLDEIDFDKYKFKVITFEHNLFQSMDTSGQVHTEEHKQDIIRFYNKSREKFKSEGYEILCGNVNHPFYGFVEDWYIKPDLLENVDYEYLRCEKKDIGYIVDLIVKKQSK